MKEESVPLKDKQNTLDLSSIPLLQRLSCLPVIVDPSHATGRSDLVCPVSRGAIATGVDGLMIEVHQNPDQALSDGEQCLVPQKFNELLVDVQKLAQVLDKKVI